VNKLLLPLVFSIIVISGTTPTAFAGVLEGDPNFVHASWDNPTEDRVPPTEFKFDTASPFELFDGLRFIISDANGEGSCFFIQVTNSAFCRFTLPNFVDDLDTKKIKMEVEFTGPEPFDPVPEFLRCFEVEGIEEGPPFTLTAKNGVLLSKDSEPNRVTYLIECEPNPEFEEITIRIPLETTVTNVKIWTTSFNDQPPVVGGEFLPIDSAALLLAAAQSPVSWLATLTIAALGIGAYVFSRNPSNMRNIKVILRDYLDRF